MRSKAIILRNEALDKGLKRYFTAYPCKNGHVAERITVTSGCVECSKNYTKASREKAQRSLIASSQANFVPKTFYFHPEDRTKIEEFVHELNVKRLKGF